MCEVLGQPRQRQASGGAGRSGEVAGGEWQNCSEERDRLSLRCTGAGKDELLPGNALVQFRTTCICLQDGKEPSTNTRGKSYTGEMVKLPYFSN